MYKTVTLAAAIENIPDLFDRTWTCTGSTQVGDGAVTCPRAHGELDIYSALSSSCNGVFALLANELGEDTLARYTDKAGLTSTYSVNGLKTAAGSFDLDGLTANQLGWAGVGQYNDLVNEVAQYSDAFESVAIGLPLLTSDEDFQIVADAIVKATASYDDGKTAICFMGHGTEAESNAVYAKMQQVLTEGGHANYFVGTVEATPSLEDVLALVQAGSYERVVLQPLMIVAGDHANNDMAGDEEGSWKTTFEAAGYQVECLVNGLGELEAVQNLLVAHAQAAIDALN